MLAYERHTDTDGNVRGHYLASDSEDIMYGEGRRVLCLEGSNRLSFGASCHSTNCMGDARTLIEIMVVAVTQIYLLQNGKIKLKSVYD